MAARWARDNGLRLLDLGGRFNAWAGYEVVDREGPGLRADLEQDWPAEDCSVGVLHAGHIFEHLADPIHTMNEAYRVLAGGGWLFIDVPSTDGRGAFQDPTHRSFWNENSIWYYTNRHFARFIRPAYRGRFQVSRVVNYFPSEFEIQHNIPILQADLIALKPPYDERPVGEVLI
jgi:SAM-dependent methyltransferase